MRISSKLTQRKLITVIQQPGGYLHHPVFPGRMTDASLGLHPGPGLLVPLLDHVAQVSLVEVEASSEGQHAPVEAKAGPDNCITVDPWLRKYCPFPAM